MASDSRERRSPLGLGPLETAIMQVMWEADAWLTVRDIRDRMRYSSVGYTTVAKVIAILHRKGLLVRRLGDREGKPGPAAWWYRAARPMTEHIGQLIAALLDHSPDPDATLRCALAARPLAPRTRAADTPDHRHEQALAASEVALTCQGSPRAIAGGPRWP